MSRPGAGPEPQAIVDHNIGSEYEIYLGIFGNRFGTKTSRAGSGTEDEFEQAYSRWKVSSSPEILFYFQDPKHAVGDVASSELAKIETFQEKLQK